MSDIILYQYPGSGRVPSGSPPCVKVGLGLKRLGLPHRVVDLASPAQVSRHSPSGRVPAIVVDGKTISDSVFILDRLQEMHPDATLWPKSEGERATDRLWDCFATDTLYWQGFYLRWLVPENRKRVLDTMFGSGFSMKKLMIGTMAPLQLKRRAMGQGIGGRTLADVQASFTASLDMIEVGLGNGPFLQGRGEPGRGDLAVAAHLAQVTLGRDDPRMAALMAARPRLFAHVAATFEACGLPAP